MSARMQADAGKKKGKKKKKKGKDKQPQRRGRRVDDHTERDTRNVIKIYPREYADVNDDKDEDYFNVRLYSPEWTNGSRYKMGKKVGSGYFGEVFLALDRKRNDRKVVVKTLKVAKKEEVKLNREIMMLETLKHGTNIVLLMDTIQVPKSEKKGLVFEYISYVKYRDLYPMLLDEEVRHYAFELLAALDYTHSKGVMHRDVKPSNVLIDPRSRQLRLIDWGVAGFFQKDRVNEKGPGTRCYKAPELCLRYDFYGYAVDLWAFGCMFGSMIFLEHPLIRGKGSWFNQLLAITKVVGSAAVFDLMRMTGIRLAADLKEKLEGYPQKAWTAWINEENRLLCPPLALDLISRLVIPDFNERLTAAEAMDHPYFDEVRANRASNDRASSSSSSGTSDDYGAYYSSAGAVPYNYYATSYSSSSGHGGDSSSGS